RQMEEARGPALSASSAENLSGVTFLADEDFEKLKECGMIYPVFYPLPTSLRHKLSKFAGHSPLLMEFPTVFRRPGRVDPGPRVANWFIDEADGKTRVVDTLSEKEKWIPIAAGWNHEMLINRIKSKWHPTMWV
ncbi:MAG: hypothetical protein ACK52A_17660, partial [Planctomycetota bacterium]